MTGKFLGKINFAEFGTVKDYPFLIGLQLGFKLGDGSYIMNGSINTINIDKRYWEKQEREQVITVMIEELSVILKAAKVNYVSQLIGKPVEVEIDRNVFKGFRILTEVL
mgnify:CR=1 FL=1